MPTDIFAQQERRLLRLHEAMRQTLRLIVLALVANGLALAGMIWHTGSWAIGCLP